MKDAQAKMLEGLLQSLPAEDRRLCRLVTPKAPTEVMDGERADVSWITTEEIDREGEIVIARGMNDAQFKLNPIVTMNHAYDCPPIGRSLWRKRAKDGPLVGVKAKTVYPKKPETWPDDWPPDTVLTLIQAGLLQGKSVGFVRLKSHAPTSHEIAGNADTAKVSRVIDEWLLIEYAVTFLPINQNALVEAVSKSAVKPEALKQIGIDMSVPPACGLAAPPIVFTSERDIRLAIERRIAGFDFEGLAKHAIGEGIDRACGRV
jgi:hypothetical protein